MLELPAKGSFFSERFLRRGIFAEREMIYLDNSSTTRQYDEVTDLMAETAREEFGNPSSLHSLGFNASKVTDEGRKRVAKCFYGSGDVIFTSGGTESDNTALLSTCRKFGKRCKRVITTNVEHPAVLETCKVLEDEGFEVIRLEADVDGYVEPQQIKAALSEETILVSVMSVNNEVGTIEPVVPAFRTVKDFNRKNGTHVLFHTDAVQAFGKLSFEDADFDMISVSAHKLHGPKGIGAMYLSKDAKIPPYIVGGGQERGMRSGTENVPGIAGFGLAAEKACSNIFEKCKKMGEVNDYLRKGLMDSLDSIVVNGPEELGYSLLDYGKRCPSVLNISFLGTRGEVLLHKLEQDGIFVSTGSACSSNKSGTSHVLRAMRLNRDEIDGAIRFSLSEFNTIEEMDIVIDRVKEAVTTFRRLGRHQ